MAGAVRKSEHCPGVRGLGGLGEVRSGVRAGRVAGWTLRVDPSPRCAEGVLWTPPPRGPPYARRPPRPLYHVVSRMRRPRMGEARREKRALPALHGASPRAARDSALRSIRTGPRTFPTTTRPSVCSLCGGPPVAASRARRVRPSTLTVSPVPAVGMSAEHGRRSASSSPDRPGSRVSTYSTATTATSSTVSGHFRFFCVRFHQ